MTGVRPLLPSSTEDVLAMKVVISRTAAAPGDRQRPATTSGRRSRRDVGVLLAPVLVGALVLTLTVIQARSSTVAAPGAAGRRQFVDGVYEVRLGDPRAAQPDGFTTRLTGRQAAQLADTVGVASVTRVRGRVAATVPTLSDCDPVTAPPVTAPGPLPSPSPLPPPRPPAQSQVMPPGGDPATHVPTSASRSRTGGAAAAGKGRAATPSGPPPDTVGHFHDRAEREGREP